MEKSKNSSRTLITAAGGVVIHNVPKQKEPEVLLIFRRGVWDLPKGKLEKSETVEECAVREVAEEVGLVEIPQIISPLSKTYHEYELGGEHLGKTTHWYMMELSSKQNDFKPEHEEGIEKVEWFALSKAKQKVGYDNLSEVLSGLGSK